MVRYRTFQLSLALHLELREHPPELADVPAVESVSIVYSGVGQLFRAVAPVATALFIDMMGDEDIQKAVLSEDPAFYRGLDELGICVFDMNDDDAATAGGS